MERREPENKTIKHVMDSLAKGSSADLAYMVGCPAGGSGGSAPTFKSKKERAESRKQQQRA